MNLNYGLLLALLIIEVVIDFLLIVGQAEKLITMDTMILGMLLVLYNTITDLIIVSLWGNKKE